MKSTVPGVEEKYITDGVLRRGNSQLKNTLPGLIEKGINSGTQKRKCNLKIRYQERKKNKSMRASRKRQTELKIRYQERKKKKSVAIPRKGNEI